LAALNRGIKAPPVDLVCTDGSAFHLDSARRKGPVLLAFFKVSCPVCQMAAPWLARMQREVGGPQALLIGVSQDEAAPTQAFMQRFEINFAVALDPAPRYIASNAYQLTHVPSLFWIASNGVIEQSVVGFDRVEYETLAERLATANRVEPRSLFGEAPGIPAFKAG